MSCAIAIVCALLVGIVIGWIWGWFDRGAHERDISHLLVEAALEARQDNHQPTTAARYGDGLSRLERRRKGGTHA